MKSVSRPPSPTNLLPQGEPKGQGHDTTSERDARSSIRKVTKEALRLGSLLVTMSLRHSQNFNQITEWAGSFSLGIRPRPAAETWAQRETGTKFSGPPLVDRRAIIQFENEQRKRGSLSLLFIFLYGRTLSRFRISGGGGGCFLTVLWNQNVKWYFVILRCNSSPWVRVATGGRPAFNNRTAKVTHSNAGNYDNAASRKEMAVSADWLQFILLNMLRFICFWEYVMFPFPRPSACLSTSFPGWERGCLFVRCASHFNNIEILLFKMTLCTSDDVTCNDARHVGIERYITPPHVLQRQLGSNIIPQRLKSCDSRAKLIWWDPFVCLFFDWVATFPRTKGEVWLLLQVPLPEDKAIRWTRRGERHVALCVWRNSRASPSAYQHCADVMVTSDQFPSRSGSDRFCLPRTVRNEDQNRRSEAEWPNGGLAGWCNCANVVDVVARNMLE